MFRGGSSHISNLNSRGSFFNFEFGLTKLHDRARATPRETSYGSTHVCGSKSSIVPGCSFHCVHFMENTRNPSFRYRIDRIFGTLLASVLFANFYAAPLNYLNYQVSTKSESKFKI